MTSGSRSSSNSNRENKCTAVNKNEKYAELKKNCNLSSLLLLIIIMFIVFVCVILIISIVILPVLIVVARAVMI